MIIPTDDFQLSDGPTNPLMRPLQREEKDLLQILWDYLLQASKNTDGLGWPYWFYVEKMFRRQYPSGPDAKDVLASLPSVSRPPQPQPVAPYSLVWYQTQATQQPNPADRVGLTIAGLAQLGSINSVCKDVANELVSVIRGLAQYEEDLEPQPHVVPTSTVNLQNHLEWFLQPSREKPFVVPGLLICELLGREFVGVSAYSSGGQFTASLYGASLREFLTVPDAASYLDLIVSDSLAAEVSDWHHSPLPLVETLDYLTYVLAADRAFGLRLVEAPDLRSALSLGATVATVAEFESHMNGIWNVIGAFKVPECSDEDLKARFGGDAAKGSLNYFECWLKANLDGPGFERSEKALQVIRSIRKIRVSQAHSRHDTRAAAINAQRRLGLPDTILDWGTAFELVKDRLAGAFDLIRQEAQYRDKNAQDSGVLAV
ncbi:hypothetical protein SB659_17440 [Arthrobacter sp. SIMBA_036]|uniref:hypothetical protein n=1 Tax=Arthrobacter sp. SIMBA_036 TaxID=3085778 RepID=UPI00397E55B6